MARAEQRPEKASLRTIDPTRSSTLATSPPLQLLPKPLHKRTPSHRRTPHLTPLYPGTVNSGIHVQLAPHPSMHKDMPTIRLQRPRHPIILPLKFSPAAARKDLAGRRIDREREEVLRLREILVPRLVDDEVAESAEVERKNPQENDEESLLRLGCAGGSVLLGADSRAEIAGSAVGGEQDTVF